MILVRRRLLLLIGKYNEILVYGRNTVHWPHSALLLVNNNAKNVSQETLRGDFIGVCSGLINTLDNGRALLEMMMMLMM